MEVVYEQSIVWISIGISFIGSYLGISLCEQLRVVSIINSSEIHSKTGKWYTLIALSIGILSIWSSQLLSMVSMDIYVDNEALPVRFHFVLPLILLSTTIVSHWIGIFFSSMDTLFYKTRLEVMELYHPHIDEMHTPQIRKLTKKYLPYYLWTKDLKEIILGSIICSMSSLLNHYICMRGYVSYVRVKYNIGGVIGSILLCFIMTFCSHIYIFRFLAMAPHKETLRIGTAMLLTISTCGTGYIGLVSRRYEPTETYPPRVFNGLVFQKHALLYPLLICSMIVAGLIVVYLMASLRKITHKHLSRLKPQFDPIRGTGMMKLGSLVRFPWSFNQMKSWQSHQNKSVSTVQVNSISSGVANGTTATPSVDKKEAEQPIPLSESSKKKSKERLFHQRITDIVVFKLSSSSAIAPSSSLEDFSVTTQ